MPTKKNHKWHGVTLPPPVCCGLLTDVVTGIITALEGQVVNVTSGPIDEEDDVVDAGRFGTDELDVDVGCGDNVKVSPSVVSVVGEVTLGRVRVFDPTMITPELEVNVWPSGRVVISSLGVVVLKVLEAGSNVKVSLSVVNVVGEVTLGRVKVFDPTMITPELEVNV